MRGPFLLAAPAIGMWAGAWLALSLGWTATTLALITLAVVALATHFAGRRASVALLLTFAALLGSTLGSMRVLPLRDSTLQSWAGHRLPISAVVVVNGEPTWVSGYTRGSYRRADGWRVAATLLEVRTTQQRALRLRVPVELGGSGVMPTLIPGTRLRVVGSLAPGEVTRAVACRVRAREWTLERGPPTWQRGVAAVRADLVEVSRHLPGDARGLFPGLTLGDTRAVAPDLTTAMKATGLTHLTAVSGGNLAVTLAMVLALARWFRWSRRTQVVVASLTLGIFVLLVHAEPSVLRAAVMAGVALIAFLLERPRAAVAGLFTSVTLLLLIDPWLARSWGFALSAAATGGLLLLAGVFTRVFERWLPRAFAMSLGVAVAAQVATAPLISALAGGVPLASIPANLLAVPAAGPATAFGLAAAVLATLWQPAAAIPTILGGAATWWIAFVARTIASWSLPVIRLGSGWLAALSSGLLIFAAVAIYRWWPRLQPRVPAFVRRHARSTVALVMVLCLALWLSVPALLRALEGWPPDDWIAVACDIGQGDGLVLRTRPSHAVVIDTGPEPQAMNRCLNDLGIEHVDFIVLTHFHADHVEGLAGVIARRDVGYIVVTGLVDPADEAARIQRITAPRHIPLRTIEPGWAGVDATLSWQTLWPLRYIKGQGSDPNNASIVLLVRDRGVSFLLTGDVEPAAQQAIEHTWLAPHVDVLKVPHHGSSHQAPEFAGWSGAHLALISVGTGNPYGHPAASTIAELQADHMVIGRTDQDGDLAVVAGPNGPALVRRRRRVMARCRT